MADRTVTLFHAPRTRSSGVLTLLEELGAPYRLELVDIRDGRHLTTAFRAVNPLGKVPALRDASGAIVTEQVAIFLHLADLFPEAGMAPPIGDPNRGPYLRWMAFYAACFEPALVDRAMQREPGRRAMSPYGTYDEVMDVLAAALRPGPYLLGETISAADILWGGALSATMRFKVVPERPEFVAYAQRITDRPAAQRARDKDAALIAARDAA